MSDESLSWRALKWFTKVGAKTAYHSGRLGFKAAEKTAKFTWDHREQIAKGTAATAATAGGIIKGTAEFAYNTGSLFYYDKESLKALEKKIDEQSKKYKHIVQNNSHLLDAGIIAGTALTDYLAHDAAVPADVENAFELAYPNLADEYFVDVANSFETKEQLAGFLAGVKGKLFEIKYAEHLNNTLPDGYSAELALSPTQPGWDIAILGPDSEIADVLQLKASDSVDYVTAAMHKYPDIDIVTTDEVHSQLLMHAAEENIINSNISNAALENSLEHAVHPDYDVSDMIDLKLPLASLALIAFTEFSDKDRSIYQKSFSFGDRSSKSVIAYSAGGIVAGITQTWWLGLLAAVGTRYVAGKGKRRRLEFKQLNKLVELNDKVIERYENFCRI